MGQGAAVRGGGGELELVVDFTVKPVLSGPVLNDLPLLRGQL